MLKRLFGKKPNKKLNLTEAHKKALANVSETTRQSTVERDLQGWWRSEFSGDERAYLESKAQELRDSSLVMSMGIGRDEPSKRISFLSTGGVPEVELHNLARFLNTPKDRYLARKLIEKAETYYSNDLHELHFVYTVMIPIYYRERNTDDTALPRTIQACERMITFAADVAVYLVRRTEGARHFC